MEEGAAGRIDSGKHAASVIEGGVRRKPETNIGRKGRRCGGGGGRAPNSGKHAFSMR